MTDVAKADEEFRVTEVGSVPVSWDVVTVGDVFDVQQGKALSPFARSGRSPRPFLRTSNVLWGRLDLRVVDQMDFSGEEVEKLSLQPRDLLVCEGGEVGRTAVWNGAIEGCLYQNHVHRLRCKTHDVVPEFVMYWMQAALLQLGLYSGAANRTTIPNLSGARLKKFAIPVPPPGEQRAIAAVLAKIQAAVEVQEKIVATLKELKAATMAKLFREGLRGAPLKQTEIGEIPESWEVVQVGDLLKLSSGASRPSDMSLQREEGKPFPVYGGNGVMGYSGQFLTPRESIVVGRVGAYCGSIHVCPPHSWITDNALYHRDPVSERASLHFLAELLAHLKLNRLHRKGAQPLVTQGTVQGVKIPLPPKPEQEDIARMAGLLNEQIATAEDRSATLKSFFSSMLHLLMSGRVRVTRKMIALQALEDRRKRRPKWSGKVDEKVLEEVVRRIVEAVTPEKIILFGSAARGEMGPDSDLDLLVVKACEDRREVDRTIRRQLIGIGVPKDVVVVTPEDVEEYKDIPGYIIGPALKEGKVLYAA